MRRLERVASMHATPRYARHYCRFCLRADAIMPRRRGADVAIAVFRCRYAAIFLPMLMPFFLPPCCF